MSRDSSGLRSSLAPSASSTSAEPHLDVNDRLPCLTTGRPQAAATMPAAVETLIDPEKSPPVPQLSANRQDGGGKDRAAERRAKAAPISSSEVSPLTRSATNAAAINGSLSEPSTIRSNRLLAASRSRSRRSSKAEIASSASHSLAEDRSNESDRRPRI